MRRRKQIEITSVRHRMSPGAAQGNSLHIKGRWALHSTKYKGLCIFVYNCKFNQSIQCLVYSLQSYVTTIMASLLTFDQILADSANMPIRVQACWSHSHVVQIWRRRKRILLELWKHVCSLMASLVFRIPTNTSSWRCKNMPEIWTYCDFPWAFAVTKVFRVIKNASESFFWIPVVNFPKST